MDILSIKTEGTLELKLVHPKTEKYVGVTVNLHGPDSPQLKAVNARHREQMLRGGRFKASAAKLDKNGEELLVAAIESWTFEEGEDGEQATLNGDANPACNDKNKLLLVKSIFGKQIDTALDDESAFITAS